ncbi:MAG: F0F1 ATP synthase subunit A [Chitinophagaceae bacterium]|nr:F0F1 ATP synthase subunit A [Chitinophagaceae bacterium]
MIFTPKIPVKALLTLLFVIFGFAFSGFAQETENHPVTAEGRDPHAEGEKKLNVKEVIFGHIRDAHDWHLFSVGDFHASLPLPVILYSPTNGLSVFMSSKFHHGHEPYNGYKMVDEHDIAADPTLVKGKIMSLDGSKFYDFSITKNVVSMLISLLLLWFLLTGSAKKYKNNGINKAPTGWQNALEPVIGFVQDNVAKPYLGKQYLKYMPLLLTFFFFIWINNLLGLLPGGANLTGNIAVTLLLTLVFFVVMLANSTKYFWGHMLNPPGIPMGIKFILVPIEILSNLLIKPAALAIRLFANIFAGHTIILSLMCMIFIFGAMSKVAGFGVSLFSVAFSVFMFFLELLVAAIQAFIFTNLAAVFIGQAIEEHHHEEHGAHH